MEGILGIEVLTSLWYLNQPGNRIETFPVRTSAMSFRVRSIWATGCRIWAKRLSQRPISRHCPTAAIALRSHQHYLANDIDQ